MQARGRVGSSPTSEYIMMCDDPMDMEDVDWTNILFHNRYKTAGSNLLIFYSDQDYELELIIFVQTSCPRSLSV